MSGRYVTYNVCPQWYDCHMLLGPQAKPTGYRRKGGGLVQEAVARFFSFYPGDVTAPELARKLGVKVGTVRRVLLEMTQAGHLTATWITVDGRRRRAFHPPSISDTIWKQALEILQRRMDEEIIQRVQDATALALSVGNHLMEAMLW